MQCMLLLNINSALVCNNSYLSYLLTVGGGLWSLNVTAKTKNTIVLMEVLTDLERKH